MVQDMIVKDGFYIVKSNEQRLTVEDAQNFYAEHKGKSSIATLISCPPTRPVTFALCG